jgi:hypothetical protein
MSANIDSFGNEEAVPSQEIMALFQSAEEAATFDEALSLVAKAVTMQLLEAMKAARVPKAEKAVEALTASGLDRLLVEAWARGKITYKMVDAHLNRLRKWITTRDRAETVKQGILAFDGAAQRLALVAGRNGPFSYPTRNNHARDSLITFARALHR